MNFEPNISLGSNVPIFRQIVDQVRLAAATGKIGPGDQLASVRALAERLLVNPNTIAKAYAELAREGIIDTQQGRGVFIAQRRQIYTKGERLRRIEPLLESLVHEALSLGFTRAEISNLVEDKMKKLMVASSASGGRHE